MKTKIKNLALLSAIAMFMLSLLGLGGSLRAFADGGGFPEPVPDSEYIIDPDENLTSLYYFSDYYESEEYFYNGFLREYIERNQYITDAYLYYNGNGSFWDMIGSITASNEIDIENAFIIFEVRNSLSIEPGVFTLPITQRQIYEHYEDSVYPALGSLFRTWKDSGCKIMFISGTDKVWFEQDPMNEFLEYVDIHINTDLRTPFTYSLTHISCTEYNFENGVIILDSTTFGDWYFRKFLLPHIVSEYIDMGITLNVNPPIVGYDDYDDINVVESILTELDLTVYFYDNVSGEYRDIYGGSVCAETVEYAVYSGYLCIVGGIESFSDETLWDLYRKGGDAEFFVYNLAWEKVVGVPDGIKYCGLSTQRFNYYLSAIMRDFILNDDLSLQKYDNWDGYCVVTFKPIFSGDGWLMDSKAFVLPEIEEEVKNEI